MKILYVTTISETINAFLIPHIKMLYEEGNVVDIACHIVENRPISEELIQLGCAVYDIPFSRSPLSKDNIDAYRQLKLLVRNGSYDIVHCHTPNASVCVRLACRRLRKEGLRVFYTAHGFHFYKGAPLKNWLLYYPAEWLCAHWTDTLITINKEDYALAQKRMRAQQVVYVPGVGIDYKKLARTGVDRVAKRKELGIPENAMLLLSVGELNENKNHETVIRAIAGMDVYYIIAGNGERKEYLEKVAVDVGMTGRVELLGYRTDVKELYEVSDVFVFPSYREGLSASLMEAMAMGLPVVCSKIRGNVDLIDENGGVLFSPKSLEDCRSAVKSVFTSDMHRLGRYNSNKIREFGIGTLLVQMKQTYECVYDTWIDENEALH